ncbi:uncharacterized protein EMH_0014720 [Eimeria mitis]|uniref:Uncharacterized protein n=1 Tax=Eimeria mitis TaxID=44415 RepID=U6K5J9_9EIME|nr:uncharacterized protein EMH_0014720 [Eimeria mitis]CDJ33099.1 hypothetical protein, conserved [Eimeria mitis]
MLLEVAGEFTVPNIRSKEELQEVLLAKNYVLDLRGTEIRMSDSVRREVYQALGVVEEDGVDLVKRSIFLNGSIANAPPGSNELVRCFLRRGTREEHFSLLRELAKRRRAELEGDVTKRGATRQQRATGGKIAQKHADRQTQSADLIRGQNGADSSGGAAADTQGDEKGEMKSSGSMEGAGAVAGNEGKGSNYLQQPCDELTTFRSATTASELGTFR